MSAVCFRNALLCLPTGEVRPGHLEVRDGQIVRLGGHLDGGAPDACVVDCAGDVLAPGFVDLHAHGALRRDAMEATPDALETICRHHARGGTTTLALTTVCASWHDIGRALDAVRDWRSESGRTGARLAGMHVEGPYFSALRMGAHRAEFRRDPKPGDIDHWIRYDDVITQITLAPELPGAMDIMRELLAAGLRVSAGHSDAWDEEANAAFEAGVRQVTHVFNAMSSARRRGPFRAAGLLEAALAHPDVVCEVIADGHHVSPTLLRMLWAAKGPRRIAIVTDAGGGAGLAEGEEFRLGDLACRVHGGVGMTLDGTALASSTCGMIDGVRTLVERAGVPLGEAVLAATATPARQLSSAAGRLAPGAPADLVRFGANFTVRETWIAGRRVFPD